MNKEVIGGANVLGLPYSKAIRAGDFVYLSGQVAFDEGGKLVNGGIEVQTRQTLHNIKTILGIAGCTLDRVIKVNVWLDDARDFGRFNAIYGEVFSNDPPARSTVVSKLVIDAKIEIDCIAYDPKGAPVQQ
jgi:reactive intermediate/imine deaminase